MAEFTNEDLIGSRFEKLRMDGAQFHRVYLTSARFDMVDLTGSTFRDVDLVDVEIRGVISNVHINDVDVGPLIDAELDRRYPGRATMRPVDADGYREAWLVLDQLWRQTVERARGFSPALLNERVNGEWSFIETLRHLVFATDSWLCRVILGDPSPWDPLDLPFDGMVDDPSVEFDRLARPSLDVVLELRADRTATVRNVLAELSDLALEQSTTPVLGPGWPEPGRYSVRQCLSTILNEEWEHRRFAERDLDSLGSL